jgi:hypothetical protein
MAKVATLFCVHLQSLPNNDLLVAPDQFFGPTFAAYALPESCNQPGLSAGFRPSLMFFTARPESSEAMMLVGADHRILRQSDGNGNYRLHF